MKCSWNKTWSWLMGRSQLRAWQSSSFIFLLFRIMQISLGRSSKPLKASNLCIHPLQNAYPLLCLRLNSNHMQPIHTVKPFMKRPSKLWCNARGLRHGHWCRSTDQRVKKDSPWEKLWKNALSLSCITWPVWG